MFARADSYEIHGNLGTAAFTQSGGTNTSPYLCLGNSSTGSGTYDLSGSAHLTVTNSIYVGNWGSAAITQSGGSNTIGSVSGNVVVSPSSLFLGCNSNSKGAYNLNGSGYLYATGCEYVGCSGTGTFIQSGGTNTSSFYLYLGCNAGGSGTYNLSGAGCLSAGQEYIGILGSGTFNQSGGTNVIPPFYYFLYLGYDVTGSGTYNLSGTGYLTAPTLTVARH